MSRASLSIVVLYVATLAVVAFWHSPIEDLVHIQLDPASHRRFELLGNIALFIPFGVLGVLATRSAMRTLAAGAVASGFLELSQFALSPERVADPSDVAKNLLGAAIGCALAHAFCRRRDSATG